MKKLITNYTFDASAQTLTLTDYASLNQEGLLLITNTTDNVIIYNFASPTYKATVTGNVISLTYNTTSMSNSDDIQIWYDDGVAYPLTDTQLRASAVPVSTGGLTDTQLRASDVPVTLGGESVTVAGPLTDAQLRASDVKVSLDGESVAVTGSFYQATQPVSGPLTNTELRAADVKVSLDGESVAVTGPLTDTQLRASAVPVSDSSLLTELQAKTEPSDIQQTELITAFRQMFLSLVYPPHLDRTANRIRTTEIIESGTVTTVTTVAGITNIDGYQGKTIPINLSLSSWAQVVRNRIS